MTTRRNCGIIGQRDIVEEAVAALRYQREQIETLLPFKLLIHLPPPEGNDPVVLEIAGAKLKQ